MAPVGIDDQVRKAFQDVIAPGLHAIRGDIRVLDQKIDGVDHRLTQKIDSLDQKIDSVDARLTIEIDALRTEMGSLKAELLAEIRRSTPGSTAWIASSGPRSTSASVWPRSKPAVPPDGPFRRLLRRGRRGR
jgi:hypothetical protein